MYRPVSLFIGLHYIFKNSKNQLGNFVFYISILSIIFGVMAMITVLSIMNGFKYELQNNILKFTPQVIISSIKGSLNPQEFKKNNFKLKGISNITPLTIDDVILQHSRNLVLGVMLGIDPTYDDPLTPYLLDAKLSDLESGKYNVIIGEQLALQLEVKCGDQIRVLTSSINQYTPMGNLPMQRLFNVIGTFSTENEVSNYQILVNINDASNLMLYPIGNFTGWRLWLKDPMKLDKFLQQKLPNGLKYQDWRERKGELFQAVQMEKNMVILLLGMIIIVSVFSIISSLTLVITEKYKDIAILQTQGLVPYQITLIFMIKGIISGIIGTILGILLGLIMSTYLSKLIFIINLLFNCAIPPLPIIINFSQIIWIMIITIFVTIFSTFYPSWSASSIQPIEALRYG